MTYAATTSVPIERTKAEIEKIILASGADNYATFTSSDAGKIAFELNGRRIMFELPLPDRSDPAFSTHSRGRRTAAATNAKWEQACRSKWRALFLTIKAKLESIEAGIETFDEAFLAHIMTPDGHRFADHAIPAIETAYQNNGTPALMLEGPKGGANG